ncbi:MAG TPA: hypothetical protein VJI32_00725 [Candidatus Nanoarchaeia archaeon]|nr:hypothetical protein [Candidatus Nanoarchaeia archaeon]
MKEFKYEHNGLPALDDIRLADQVYHSLDVLFPHQKPIRIRIVGTPTRSNGMIFQYNTGIVAVVHANYKASRQVGPYEQELVPVRGFISVKVFPVGENDLILRIENCLQQFGLVAVESKGDLYI